MEGERATVIIIYLLLGPSLFVRDIPLQCQAGEGHSLEQRVSLMCIELQ